MVLKVLTVRKVLAQSDENVYRLSFLVESRDTKSRSGKLSSDSISLCGIMLKSAVVRVIQVQFLASGAFSSARHD